MNDHTNIIIGTVLSKQYVILGLIGKGGMAEVYSARQVKLDRDVAVKVLSPTFLKTLDSESRESTLKRFRREAAAAAKINHPNVIEVYDVGRDVQEIDGVKQDLDFIVMAHLPGGTIRDTMDEYGFEDEKEIRNWLTTYMYPMLQGVIEVHRYGIIHRDIKPENFLMRDHVPVLADFGLSKNNRISSMTHSMEDIIGTMQYMAPEQDLGFKFAKEPADVYSLTKIIYEMIEGKIKHHRSNFKQVTLSSTDTPFIQKLNNLILDGTNVDQNRRILSAEALLTRLDFVLSDNIKVNEKGKTKPNKYMLAAAGTLLIGGLLAWPFLHNSRQTHMTSKNELIKKEPIGVEYNINKSNGHNIIVTDDSSTMHYIPGGYVKYPSDYGSFSEQNMNIKPFYLSSSPVTNQQYVNFLNEVRPRLSIENNVVKLGGKTWLRLGEFIAGYKPIIYKEGEFRVKTADHASCPVLRITGYGAKAYAEHYARRLPTPKEIVYAYAIGDDNGTRPPPIPSPIGNYQPNRYGIRALNSNISEWGYDGSQFSVVGKFPDNHAETPSVKQVAESKVLSNGGFRTVQDP